MNENSNMDYESLIRAALNQRGGPPESESQVPEESAAAKNPQPLSVDEHLTRDELVRLHLNFLEKKKLDAFQSHIAICSTCRKELGSVKKLAEEVEVGFEPQKRSILKAILAYAGISREESLPRPGRFALIFAAAAVCILVCCSIFYLLPVAHPGDLKLAIRDPLVRGLNQSNQVVLTDSSPPMDSELMQEVLAELKIGKTAPAAPAAVLALQQIVSPLPQEPVLGNNQAPSKQIVLESPVGTSVRSLPVTLRWQQLNGASEYRIILRNATTGAVLSQTSTSNKLQWEQGIEPGAIYQWQVTANVLNENAASLPARFRVLSASDQSKLTALESQFRESPLILAAIYRKFTLMQENEQARAKFFLANPRLKTLQAP